jgi:hypothetical protein
LDAWSETVESEGESKGKGAGGFICKWGGKNFFEKTLIFV